MSWLVTGGAGYIGAHVVRAFQEVGLDVVVIDDLSSGHREFVQPEVPVRRGQHRRHRADGARPWRSTTSRASCTWRGSSTPASRSTVRCTPTPRTSPARSTCSRRWSAPACDTMVFSSSAATFGTPDVELVTEETATRPESPYGESKLIGEWLIRDQARATGLRHTSLRYFNVVGSGSDDLYDTSPHNLFPIVFEMLLDGQDAADQRRRLRHPRRHLRARLRPRRRPRRARTSSPPSASRPARPLQPVYNLGSGTGSSVARDHGRDPHR